MVSEVTMNDAELRISLDSLGLTARDAAAIFGVREGRVTRWLANRDRIPLRISADVARMRATQDRWVAWIRSQLCPESAIYIYRSDEELWAALPDTRPYPASWWRATVARARDNHTFVRYWTAEAVEGRLRGRSA